MSENDADRGGSATQIDLSPLNQLRVGNDVCDPDASKGFHVYYLQLRRAEIIVSKDCPLTPRDIPVGISTAQIT